MSLSYAPSFWEYRNFLAKLDLLIIGAGFSGLQTAIRLKELAPNLRLAVVERGTLPIGASTRNAGFACFGTLTELRADLQRMSEDTVWQTVDRRYRGLQLLRQRFPETTIRYKAYGGYEVFEPHERETWSACLDQLDYFNQRTEAITGHTKVFEEAPNKIAELGISGVAGLIQNRLEGQLDPAALLRHLIKRAASLDIPIFNGLEITKLEEGPAEICLHHQLDWPLRARRVLLTTNAFSRQLLPELPIQPARNQVLITEPLPNLLVKGCFHYQEGYVYWRNVENRLLIGGGRHLDLAGESTTEFGVHDSIRTYLHQKLSDWTGRSVQNLPIAFQWSGIIAQGPDKSPIVRQLSDRITVAVRLAGMGVALSSLLAEEASALILDKG